MRVLVTGGAGFLGRHVARALAAQGDRVTVLDDLSSTNSNFTAPELQHAEINLRHGSTHDLALIQRLVREHDAIFHFASVVGVEETIRRPIDTMLNLQGTLNIVGALSADQSIVFTSSADVYGLHSHLYDRPMHEDDSQLFESSDVNRWVYPKTKSLEENAILNGAARAAVVRVFNCFGPEMDFPHGKRVVPQFLQRILAQEPLLISGSGRQRRALCYYMDTVRGLLLAMRYLLDDLNAAPLTVNIGGTETYTILELAELLQEIAIDVGLLDAALPIEFDAEIYSQHFDDSWDRVPNIERAATVLGYVPQVAVRDGLRQTLEYYAAAGRKAGAPPVRTPPTAYALPDLLETDVLIVGGGITGLACRAALAGTRTTLLLEAEPDIGGLLRIYSRGGYTFDTAVHALTFRNPEVRQLFDGLLPLGYHVHERRNLIWQDGRVIDYPYQFHLHQLPPEVEHECRLTMPAAPIPELAPASTFETWLLAQFGDGLYRHFFEQYNSKLYGVAPAELEAGPMVWTIPIRDHARMRGADAGISDADQPRDTFLYPRGPEGIFALASALARRCADTILCQQRVVAIDMKRRVVTTSGGLQVRYHDLVSSMPLPQLAGACSDIDPSLGSIAARLQAAPVTVIEIGVRARTRALDAHWSYFPDQRIPFYRMTRLEQMSEDLCREGHSALLLECPGNVVPPRAQVLAALAEVGVLSIPDVEWYGVRSITSAYVIFRPGTTHAALTLRAALLQRGIQSVGRFGEWRYMNIEQCITAGLDAARALAPRHYEGSSPSHFGPSISA